MEYLIGLILSLVVAGFAIIVGFDRDRAFYPTVIASCLAGATGLEPCGLLLDRQAF